MSKRTSFLFISCIFLWSTSLCRADTQTPGIQAQEVRQVQNVIEYDGVTYTQSGTPKQMDIASPPIGNTPLPVVVCIHGGSWSGGNRGDMHDLMLGFAANGYLACSIDYTLSGTAPFPAQIQDCKCAVRFLRAHADILHLNPKRICAFGLSAGGHLALLLGLTPGISAFEGNGGWGGESSNVTCVLDWYGPTDLTGSADASNISPGVRATLEALFGGDIESHREVGMNASPVTYVKTGAPPILIMQGDSDTTVPEDQSIELYNRLKAVGDDVTLDIVKGAGHGPIGAFTTPDQIATMRAFLTRVL